MQKEIALKSGSLMEALQERWQIIEIDVGLDPGANLMAEMVAFKAQFKGPLRRLMEMRGKSGLDRKPSALICDVRS